jgi:hypothetical protein
MEALFLGLLFSVQVEFMRRMMWPERTTTFEERMANAKWWEL